MSKKLKIAFVVVAVLTLITREKVCEHPGFGHANLHAAVFSYPDSAPNDFSSKEISSDTLTRDLFIHNSKLKGSDGFRDNNLSARVQFFSKTSIDQSDSEPIRADWKVLMDIEYELEYYKEFNMEIYAPIFSKKVKKLHGKEIIIDGHVIPLDVQQEIVALSYNPYASCFFCGQASPASVMSLHLKDKSKRYKKDSFNKFKGTLYLNQDNPDEFYYILRNAIAIKN